jgi:hypothetical protein
MKAFWVPLLLVLASASAAAQSVSVLPPADPFVRPGDTLTLTFELVSPEAVGVDLEASTTNGWTVSVEPTRVSLEADAVATVTVTVEVPDDAAAFASERLTLRVGGVDPAVETTTQLNVREVVDLRLEAPAQAPIGVDGLRGFIVNAGNSARDVVLELRLADEVVASQASSLIAGDRVEFRFDLADEGDHTLVLRSAGAANVERTVRALRFGSPEPEPFVLAGELVGAVGLGGDWETTLTVRGRLSDFGSLNLLAAAPDWRRSYVDLTLEHGTVRAGAGGAAPFRLDLPKDLGLAATYERDGFGFGGMVAATASDELSAYAAASYAAPTYSVAAGGGVRAGSPVAAISSGYTAEGLVMALSGKYQDEKLGAKLTATIREEQTTTNLRVEARDFLSDRSRLDFEVRLRTGPTSVYGNVTAPLGERATWAWRTGLTHDLAVDLPGNLQLALQAGSSESFARASHRITLGDEWRTTNVLGVRLDTKGFGLTLDSGWSYLALDELSLSTRLTYYPGTGVIDGQFRAKLQVVEDPVSLALDGNWNVTSETLGASAVLGLFDGPWSFDVDASARYAYTRETDPWTFELGASLSYAFDVTVSDDIVEGTGGRRLGTLIGTVVADGRPVAGVVVSVGRFRVMTDEAGRFELRVAPGSYRVGIDRGAVPEGYRVAEPR